MFKKSLLAVALSVLPFTASADLTGGYTYHHFFDDIGSNSISLGAVSLGLGYKFKVTDNFSIAPEYRVGKGIVDDKLFGVDVELDGFNAFAIRGEYEFDSQWYAYLQPTYTKFRVSASAAGNSASADDWEFGTGIGAGYEFKENTTVEVGYEYIDGTDALTLGLRFGF